jgi:predicted NBD/HSP70 family sugar kinase
LIATNKGGNMTKLKYQNRSLILNILKKNGSVSRADIAEILQLTPAAITILVNEMEQEGIIVEIGQLEKENGQSGRRKQLIDINSTYRYVIGINLESDNVNIGVSNLKGETVAYKRKPVDKLQDPEQMIQEISAECIDMLWKKNITKESVIGVGVGIVGKVDRKNGISEHAYGLWNKKVNVGNIFRNLLGIRVIVDNNVRALALGELEYYNQDEVSNILFVKYGPGIGSALILNNEIYYGSYNGAGEIGHTLVDCSAKTFEDGRDISLETIASEKAIISEVRMVFKNDTCPVLFSLCEGSAEEINIVNIYKAAELGDLPVCECIRKATKYIASAIYNAVSIYDPSKVILYGKVFENDFFMNEFTTAIQSLLSVEYPKDLVTLSRLNRKHDFIAGTAIALREFFYNTGGI